MQFSRLRQANENPEAFEARVVDAILIPRQIPPLHSRGGPERPIPTTPSPLYRPEPQSTGGSKLADPTIPIVYHKKPHTPRAAPDPPAEAARPAKATKVEKAKRFNVAAHNRRMVAANQQAREEREAKEAKAAPASP